MELNVSEMQDEFNRADATFNEIGDISLSVESEGGLTLKHAMELDRAASELNAVSRYYAGGDTRRSLSTEGIIQSLFTAIGKVFEAIIRMIVKFISWLIGTGDSEKAAVSAKNAVSDVKDHVDLSDLDKGVKFASESVSLEKELSINIPVKQIFSKWSESLTDQEVDFITSGRRYNSIQLVLSHLAHSDMPLFVSKLNADIQKWMSDGFQKAPHVGRDDMVVASFIRDSERAFEKIRSDYAKDFRKIDDMEAAAKMDEVVGDHTHLELFMKTPSRLFPHLEMIWKSIDFKRINGDDKRLIGELEKVKKQFENNVTSLKQKLNIGETSWPAMEAFTRLANSGNREIAKRISTLAHVCVFVRKSADIAFKATLKCFNYIKHLLKELTRVPEIDHDKLMKGFDVIQNKYRELSELVNMPT